MHNSNEVNSTIIEQKASILSHGYEFVQFQQYTYLPFIPHSLEFMPQHSSFDYLPNTLAPAITIEGLSVEVKAILLKQYDSVLTLHKVVC